MSARTWGPIVAPRPRPGINSASGGELGARPGEESEHGGLAGIPRLGQSRPGLGNAFAATGANAEFTGQIAQILGAVLHRRPDMPLGNRFAHTDNHEAYCERECE